MSYIRSISNPEGLYIWGDGEMANITTKDSFRTYMRVPMDIIDGLILKYHRSNLPDVCSYKGCKISEIMIDGALKMKLEYADWSIFMWDVTWTYIVYTNVKNARARKKNN
jgi:hypothetical protein